MLHFVHWRCHVAVLLASALFGCTSSRTLAPDPEERDADIVSPQPGCPALETLHNHTFDNQLSVKDIRFIVEQGRLHGFEGKILKWTRGDRQWRCTQTHVVKWLENDALEEPVIVEATAPCFSMGAR